MKQQSRALTAHSQTLKKMQALTESEAQAIKKGLAGELRQMQSQTIDEALSPLRESLTQLQKEGEALHSITIKAWLKPLLISFAITVGVAIGAYGVSKTMSLIYSQKIDQLSELNQEIAQAKATLDTLPNEITFVIQEGKQYILSPALSKTFNVTKGKYQGQMAVEIE